jgi:hypothetical protein
VSFFFFFVLFTHNYIGYVHLFATGEGGQEEGRRRREGKTAGADENKAV